MTTTLTPATGTNVSLLQLGPGATGYGAIDWRRMLGSAQLQEGVLSSGGFKVTAGAGMTVSIAASTGNGALVQGDSITLQGLYYVAPHTAAIVENITTAHATLPRIDQVILEVLDATHDGGASNTVRTRVVDGTATSGATLDNRTGAAALPASAIRLADVLVPAAAASILAGNIRDRRAWAHGASWWFTRTRGNYTTASTTYAAVDATNMSPRIECSGVTLNVRFDATYASNNAAGEFIGFQLYVDGVTQNVGRESADPAVSTRLRTDHNFTITPTAGSHIIAVYWRVSGGTGTIQGGTTGGFSATMMIEEDLRPNASNT